MNNKNFDWVDYLPIIIIAIGIFFGMFLGWLIF
jgi:hypothetical protein